MKGLFYIQPASELSERDRKMLGADGKSLPLVREAANGSLPMGWEISMFSREQKYNWSEVVEYLTRRGHREVWHTDEEIATALRTAGFIPVNPYQAENRRETPGGPV